MTDHNIIVHDNVTQIDGMYAAKKNVYTCNVIPGLQVCAAPLVVNGAVVAGQNIVPLRTAGASLPNFGEMAETFNLRPDLLLGQLSNPSSSTTFLKTINETEVPARF